jgi:hypothetical protein
MNAGRVGAQHRGLAQLLRGLERRREGHVVGLLGLDDLEQRQDGDRVEEVEPDDPLGVLEVAAISLIDSDEVFVARTHRGRRPSRRRRRSPA